VLALLVTACAFDSTASQGSGAADSTGDGTTSTDSLTTASLPSTSGTTDEPPGDSTAHSSTGMPESETAAVGSTTTSGPDTDAASSSSSSGGSTTDDCDRAATFAELIWVQDLPAAATVDMELVESVSLIYDGETVTFARSLTEDLGSVTFEFDTECDGDVYIWGLVFDWISNPASGNADSYWYGIDADGVADGDAWAYGCDSTSSGWAWRRLRHYLASPCMTEPEVPSLDAGSHTFNLLNREPGETGITTFNFAGVAAIAISNDEMYDPLADYDPAVGS
jgi:hypothetical protein